MLVVSGCALPKSRMQDGFCIKIAYLVLTYILILVSLKCLCIEMKYW